MNRFQRIFGSRWKTNRKLTQLRGLAEERKYLVRVTGMSSYSHGVVMRGGVVMVMWWSRRVMVVVVVVAVVVSSLPPRHGGGGNDVVWSR